MISHTLIPNTPDHKNALENLGLKPKWINEIALRVLTAYNLATPHDAVTAPGTYAYLAAVRAIRDILCPHGWKPLQRNNLELTEQPDMGIVVNITSGNENTGIEGAEPKTKNPKGRQTKKIVDQNAIQLSLWPVMEFVSKEKMSEDSPVSTWFLLYHIDRSRTEMRLELSLPVSMNSDETKVNGWQKRIILSPIRFDPDPFPPEQDFGPEIEFEIKRKSQ